MVRRRWLGVVSGDLEFDGVDCALKNLFDDLSATAEIDDHEASSDDREICKALIEKKSG